MSSRRLSLSLLLFCSWLAGCELVADFDRGKLMTDQHRPDSGVIHEDDAGPGQDAATPEKGAD